MDILRSYRRGSPTVLAAHDGWQPPTTVLHFQAEKQRSSRTSQLGDQTVRITFRNAEFAEHNVEMLLAQ